MPSLGARTPDLAKNQLETSVKYERPRDIRHALQILASLQAYISTQYEAELEAFQRASEIGVIEMAPSSRLSEDLSQEDKQLVRFTGSDSPNYESETSWQLGASDRKTSGGDYMFLKGTMSTSSKGIGSSALVTYKRSSPRTGGLSVVMPAISTNNSSRFKMSEVDESEEDAALHPIWRTSATQEVMERTSPHVVRTRYWEGYASGESEDGASFHVTGSTYAFRKSPMKSFSGYLGHALGHGHHSVWRPIHPECKRRIVWDVLAMICLIWDTIMTPLQMLSPPKFRAQAVFEIIVTNFWTLDMVASIHTGVYIDGNLTRDRRRIIKQYLFTWFLFDLVLVSMDWMQYFVGDTIGNQRTSFVRAMRVLRFVRLLRLLKVDAILRKILERSQAGFELTLLLRISGYLSGYLLFNHILACIWYGIGRMNSGGWVAHREQDLSQTCDFGENYLISLHWALSNFHGTMEVNPKRADERLYAVILSCAALFCVTWLTANFTNMLIQLQKAKKEQFGREGALRDYLKCRHVSPEFIIKIKKYIHHMYQKKTTIVLEPDVELIKTLSPTLMRDLHMKVRGPALMQNAFFSYLKDYNTTIFGRICSEGVQESLVEKQTVFSSGDVCIQMFLVERGPSTYQHHLSEEVEQVTEGQSLCEAALWMPWQHTGTFRTTGECLLFEIAFEEFAGIIGSNPSTHLKVARHAQNFLLFLGNTVSDLTTSRTVIDSSHLV